MSARLPLVVILGATGSGKTKLSLELAKKFGGEIISADSMQIYKGLDIITAKATVDERKTCPHHLIDELHPSQPFSVIDFRNKSLPIIDNLFARNTLPIIVGGTNYYIEALLWKILVEEPGENIYQARGVADSELPSDELHQILMKQDPIRAKRLHPNDKRKILRSLEILQKKGRKHSDILHEQQTSKGGSAFGGGLRFSNALIFWVMCEQTTLDNRLNARVDLMLQQGLIDELLDFHKKYNEERVKEVVDYTKGVFQSIGFKEFHDYLMLTPEERQNDDGIKLFEMGTEDLKRATRRYAKKQRKWIVNRFLAKNIKRDVPLVYGLDTTDVSKWDSLVRDPAIAIIESFINKVDCEHKPLPLQETKGLPNSMAERYFCEVCNRVFIGSHQWDCHIKSHKHKRVSSSKKKVS
ncbi:hypothetical protein RN001_014697 [Aquatica leii]|uniref:C2H2-type domain-containing protein n=1 Tax=Aquatica leii TaxID=1421715 RepID=A0AAN7SKP7_9COLE|nr:hypothetical protein RN001_014697 [Aquatica leii]